MSYDLYLRDIFFTLPVLKNEMDPALLDEDGDFDVSPLYKLMGTAHPDRIEFDAESNTFNISWEWSIPAEQKFSEWLDTVRTYLSTLGLDLGEESIDYSIHENYMSLEEYWFHNWAMKQGRIEKAHVYVYDGRHITFDGQSENPSQEAVEYIEDLKKQYQNLSKEDTIVLYRYMADWYEGWLSGLIEQDAAHLENTRKYYEPQIADWRKQADDLEESL